MSDTSVIEKLFFNIIFKGSVENGKHSVKIENENQN